MLINTKKASELTGLSAYELRMGFMQGRYPALIIGRGEQRRRLRWDCELLQEAIRAEMETGTREV